MTDSMKLICFHILYSSCQVRSCFYPVPFETTLHDDAYGAFMTPPLYTSTREDDEYMILENTVRYFSMQVVKRNRKGVNSTRSQVTWTFRMLVHAVNARKPKTKHMVRLPIG